MDEFPTSQLTGRSTLDNFLDYIDHMAVWLAYVPPDDDLEFTYMSSGFEDIWGRAPEELQRDSSVLLESVPPEERTRIAASIDEVRQSVEPLSTLEHRVVQPDGEVRWVEVRRFRVDESTGDELADGSTVVGITIDITARKRAEQDLQQKNEQLEEFADVVSHDLRNPLTVAEHRLELLQREYESDHLDELVRAHEQMDQLITNLLALAREGAKTKEMEPISLNDFVRACWQNVDVGDATLALDTDQMVHADRTQLRRLFENLIDNAVEHGEGTTTVSVGPIAEGFYVEDDGPGIPRKECEQVFELGYSTDDTGTGFGLAIVRRIVEAHGWNIAVCTGTDGGSRFEITGVSDGGENGQ